MIVDVVRDVEGVRMALEEIFEEGFVCARIYRQSAGASPETKERMQRQIPPRTLSPGYYVFAEHLLSLEAWQRAGVGFDLAQLAGFEARGLVALESARGAFKRKHPPCSACGTHQETRFGLECSGCGVKFRRKKER